MKKTIKIGYQRLLIPKSKHPFPVYCTIDTTKGILSITGVQGPTSNGSCTGNAGQIVDELNLFYKYEPGWNDEVVARFKYIWRMWHLSRLDDIPGIVLEFLNDLPRASSPLPPIWR